MASHIATHYKVVVLSEYYTFAIHMSIPKCPGSGPKIGRKIFSFFQIDFSTNFQMASWVAIHYKVVVLAEYYNFAVYMSIPNCPASGSKLGKKISQVHPTVFPCGDRAGSGTNKFVVQNYLLGAAKTQIGASLLGRKINFSNFAIHSALYFH
jgi:hypothetical protein